MSSQDFIILLTPFLASAAFVTLNEMGDKTQLLAMAMACRIKFWKVMIGVLIATLINHGLAVAVGSLLASMPGWQGWVKFAAALLFIVFGLWALKSDQFCDSDTGRKKKKSYGDIATVAIAFFIAEMGDKTQLATITLAANYSNTPYLVLAGTTVGMLIADGIGIFVGVMLHKRLPDRALKFFASAAFIIFGLAGLWEALRDLFKLSATKSSLIIAVAGLIAFYLGYLIAKIDKKSREEAKFNPDKCAKPVCKK